MAQMSPICMGGHSLGQIFNTEFRFAYLIYVLNRVFSI